MAKPRVGVFDRLALVVDGEVEQRLPDQARLDQPAADEAPGGQHEGVPGDLAGRRQRRPEPVAVAVEPGHLRVEHGHSRTSERLLERLLQPPAVRRGRRGQQLEAFLGQLHEPRRVGDQVGVGAHRRGRPAEEIPERRPDRQSFHGRLDGGRFDALLAERRGSALRVIVPEPFEGGDRHPRRPPNSPGATVAGTSCALLGAPCRSG